VRSIEESSNGSAALTTGGDKVFQRDLVRRIASGNPLRHPEK
jgi:hypothetical protein